LVSHSLRQRHCTTGARFDTPVSAIDSSVCFMLYTTPLLAFGFVKASYHVILKRWLIRFNRQKIY
jgi:hypothetical protein